VKNLVLVQLGLYNCLLQQYFVTYFKQFAERKLLSTWDRRESLYLQTWRRKRNTLPPNRKCPVDN